MKFKYIDYKQDLFKEAVDSKSPKLYVFDNYQNLIKAEECYQQLFLQPASHFISMDDLKEKLCPIDRLILKEEKRTLVFYDLLTEAEKNELKIDNYFDAIDLANTFFNFFDELEEYKVRTIDNLRDWQERKYQLFKSIRERYKDRLLELNYSDKTEAFNLENFSDRYILLFQEIVFVNIIDFTPKEKDLLLMIEKRGKEITLYLQMEGQDFDEDRLSLKCHNLSETPGTEIQLYHTEDKLLEMIDMINQIENIERNKRESGDSKGDNFLSSRVERTVVLDADFLNSNYHGVLNKSMIDVENDIVFTETKIYRFLNSLYELILTAKFKSRLQLETNTFLQAVYQKEFRNYFSLELNDIDFLHNIAANEYVYLSFEHLEYYYRKNYFYPGEDDLFMERYRRIYDLLKEISQIKSLQGFLEYFEGINLSNLDEDKYTNNLSQYFDALMELGIVEEMGLFNSWNKFFPTKATGFFRLLLNYLRYKKVGINYDNCESKAVIKDLKRAAHCGYENLLIINAYQGALPNQENYDSLLTDKQRGELGLKTLEDYKLIEKYYFFRHVLSSKQVIIYTIENIEENISTSPFLEELKLIYNLEIKKTGINLSDYPLLINEIFKSFNGSFLKIMSNDITQSDKLLINTYDFNDNYSLSFYKYNVLNDCYYKFYLEHIAALQEERIVLEKELGLRMLGIIIHDIFAEILLDFDRFIAMDLDDLILDHIVEDCFKRYYLNINTYYAKYYESIFLSAIKDSLLYFIKKIGSRLKGEKVVIKTEWSPVGKEDRNFYSYQSKKEGIEKSDKLLKFYFNGRIDLLIETEEKKYIIDFKTGSGNIEQLDFYSLLLSQGEEVDYQLEKSIYNVLEQKFIQGKSGTENELKEKIIEELEIFLDSGEYSFEYKARCNRCSMKEICRVV